MTLKNIPKWIPFTLFIITIIPFVIYTVKFYGYLFSDQSGDWGTFGDFIGGILNPIFALINIMVLIWLTLTVKNTEDNRHEENKKHEKRLVKIALQQEALKDFIDLRRTLYKYETNCKMDQEELKGIIGNTLVSFNALTDQYSYFFSSEDKKKWRVKSKAIFKHESQIDAANFIKIMKNARPITYEPIEVIMKDLSKNLE